MPRSACPSCGDVGYLDVLDRLLCGNPGCERTEPFGHRDWRCDNCGHVAAGPPDECPGCDVGPLGSWTGHMADAMARSGRPEGTGA